MSGTELKALRQEVKKFIDHADQKVVKMVYAMLESDAATTPLSSGLTADQEAILEERMKQYEQGLMKFSTWEEARKRIISKAKNAA